MFYRKATPWKRRYFKATIRVVFSAAQDECNQNAI